MTEALYVPSGDRFSPTELTTSPWSTDACHGGPAAALLTREIQRLEPETFHLARITIEMLSIVPRIDVMVTGDVLRPGKRVQLSTAEFSTVSGEVLAKATAWSLRHREPFPLPPEAAGSVGRLPPPEELPNDTFPGADWVDYYGDAQERRVVYGDFLRPGPAAVWFRLKVPVVAGEDPTSEQRVVAMADSANGISSVATFDDLLYINPDLTVHLARAPHGEWMAMDATSYLDPSGRGLSDTVLYDRGGYLGRANQTLFVDER